METTGVGNSYTTGVGNNSSETDNGLYTTGVDNNNLGIGNGDDQTNNQYENDEQYNEQQDNSISVENGIPEDIHITINNMSTILK